MNALNPASVRREPRRKNRMILALGSTRFAIAALIASLPLPASCQLELLPNSDIPAVFAGTARPIPVVWRNPGATPTSVEIRTRQFQATSATAVQVQESVWKNLEVLPGQTVLESARLDFPSVKAETKFVVQWLAGTNRVLGSTEVLVYPTNLLADLKRIVEPGTLGVLDPAGRIKPRLKQNGVEFSDLGERSLEGFAGRLAILGPFESKAQLPEDIAARCKTVAQNGASVVWIGTPALRRDQLKPSFYAVPVGTNTVVVAQASLLPNLSDNPQSQQKLLQLCRLALSPEPFTLPESENKP